jgi:hypothetical protein
VGLDATGDVLSIGFEDTGYNDFSLTTDSKLVIDTSGNVGIGLTSPGAKLHVTQTGTGEPAGYFYSNTSMTVPCVQILQDGAGSSGPALLLRNDGNGHALQVDDGSSGNALFVINSLMNVGIGTASPTAALTIVGNGVSGAGSLKVSHTITGVAAFNDAGLELTGTTDIQSPGKIHLSGAGTNRDQIIIVNDGGSTIIGTERSTGASLAASTANYSTVIGAISNTPVHLIAWNTPRITILGDGKVGIGTTAPGSFLDINHGLQASSTLGAQASLGLRLYPHTGAPTIGQLGQIGLGLGGTYANIVISSIRTSTTAYGTDDLIFATKSGTTQAAPTERMRITSAGTFIVGDTSAASGSNSCTSISSGGTISTSRAATNAQTHHSFLNPNGTVGSITTNGSATAYNTSSDYRLKENVVLMSGSIDRVKALKPSKFNFIVDPDKTVDGFLAHEVSSIVPEAIIGEKDAMKDEEYEVTAAITRVVDEEGNVTTEAVDAVMATRSVPDLQGIDQSKLVPLLVSALQEAIARIEVLEGA